MSSAPAAPLRDLPRPLTPFIGREHEIQAVAELLQRPEIRLVNLTGPGGAGKTRLALAVLDRIRDRYRDGVVFVALQSLTDPALVASAIAQSINAHESPEWPIVRTLVAAIGEREILLVLDNFEHLLPATSVIVELLGACPSLTICVTSRTVLNLSGEYTFLVPPLTLPGADAQLSTDQLSSFEAIELFVERATAARSDFRLTSGNAIAVASICARLDGLPLALELAAARVRSLSPHALLALLEHRLVLLTRGPRDAPARQQTMRDTIAWSYDLLHPEEQGLFRELSIFTGGWTLEAAEAVCSPNLTPSESPGAGVLEGLGTLVDHSLVQQVEQPDGAARFTMLETIREFGLEQLAAQGEEDLIRDRHAACYLAVAEDAEARLDGPTARIWLDRLDREHDNLRVALGWFRARPDVDRGLRLAGSLRQYWWLRGYLSESESQTRALLDLPGAAEDTPGRIKALAAAGQLARWRGDNQLSEMFLAAALASAERLGDPRPVPVVLLFIGVNAQQRGDVAGARDSWERARALAREVGDTSTLAQAHNHLGDAARRDGDYDLAATFLEEGLAIGRAAGLQLPCGLALLHLGILAEQRGDLERATARYQESLEIFWGLRALVGTARLVERLAGIARQPERATRLFAAAAALRERIGSRHPAVADFGYDLLGPISRLRASLGDDAFQMAWAAGWSTSLDEVVADALAVGLSGPESSGTAAAGLSAREFEVLHLLVDGCSNKEIAARLSVSQNTVASHVAHILNKLGVESRTAAATKAMRLGII